MKSRHAVLGALGLVLGAMAFHWACAEQAPPEPGSLSPKPFMRLKLEPAKQILEGIALEDFELIQKSVSEIQTLMLDENWMVLQTTEYRQHSQDFQRTLSAIQRAAKNRNIDSAALGYMQMTLNCVQCHQQLRGTPIERK
jgi:hypothetical protein